jgi:inositol phosphorylceramide mannosyltransferase catalytic subunit
MRKGIVIFAVINVLIIGFLFRSVYTLFTLLFEDCSNDAIPSKDLWQNATGNAASTPPIIPKIIHQTYINESIPEIWKEAQQSCIKKHPDYEYILWTDAKSRAFIAEKYDWFLPTFDGYPYNIQRADAIRYFILSYYGGIYIDLDNGCKRNLDPLLAYPAWLRRTVPTGISNDAMGSVPGHPFFKKVTESLQGYSRNWGVPYITVMYSTGPLFLSVIWKEYIRGLPRDVAESERVRVLMSPDYMKDDAIAFFSHHLGNSWHRDDAKAIFWVSQQTYMENIKPF